MQDQDQTQVNQDQTQVNQDQTQVNQDQAQVNQDQTQVSQDQNQQLDVPPILFPLHVPLPQEPVQAQQLPQEQQQQLTVVECPICFNDVQPNDEAVAQCNRCPKTYHRSCIIQWLTIRLDKKQAPNCPNCRRDM
ncbi:unnamed protein product, partial [Rotaria socialis]